MTNPLRLWIQSDIHDDVSRYTLPTGVDADVCIIAGDVGGRLSGEARLWLERNAPADIPTIVVAGNHDYYGASLDSEVDRFRRKTTLPGRITVLDGDFIVIGGVRFVGATLWTDLEAYGDGYSSQKEFMRQMTDWRQIRWQGRKHTQHIRHFLDAHARQLRGIEAVLAAPFDGPTVVITHHAPSRRSLDGGRCFKPIDAAYASDLDALILRHEPDLWIHGHVHHNLDYMIGRTRVVCNPRGYITKNASPKALPTVENRDFNPGLVLDVATGPRPGYSAADIDHAHDHPDVFLSRVSPPIGFWGRLEAMAAEHPQYEAEVGGGLLDMSPAEALAAFGRDTDELSSLHDEPTGPKV